MSYRIVSDFLVLLRWICGGTHAPFVILYVAHWEWQHDTDSWKPCVEEVSKELELAFRDGYMQFNLVRAHLTSLTR